MIKLCQTPADRCLSQHHWPPQSRRIYHSETRHPTATAPTAPPCPTPCCSTWTLMWCCQWPWKSPGQPLDLWAQHQLLLGARPSVEPVPWSFWTRCLGNAPVPEGFLWVFYHVLSCLGRFPIEILQQNHIEAHPEYIQYYNIYIYK